MRLLLTALFAVCFFPGTGYVQGVRGELTYTVTDEADMVRAFGPSLVFQHRSVEVQLRSVWSSQSGLGSTCSGLIPPDMDCSDEPLDVRTSFSTMRLRWAVNTRPRSVVGHFGAGVGLGLLEGSRSGDRTGRKLDAGIWTSGVELSTGLSVLPTGNSRLRVRLSADGSMWAAPLSGRCVDCHDPYDGLNELSAGIGVEYRF